jgi:hypothetical protein
VTTLLSTAHVTVAVVHAVTAVQQGHADAYVQHQCLLLLLLLLMLCSLLSAVLVLLLHALTAYASNLCNVSSSVISGRCISSCSGTVVVALGIMPNAQMRVVLDASIMSLQLLCTITEASMQFRFRMCLLYLVYV